ncbi:MAG: hypothetical protein KDK37_00935 [Leptospiraceae bacterium]|nr:hypothetical protein [Leptospiraceae bacterium]
MKRNVQIWLTLSAIVAVSALVFAGCNRQGDNSGQMRDGDMHSGMAVSIGISAVERVIRGR